MLSSGVRALASIAVAVTCCVPMVTLAAGKNREAEAEGRLGAVHLKHARFLAAVDAYRHAYELDPQPSYLLGQAEAYRGMDLYREAVTVLEQFVSVVKEPAARSTGEEMLADSRRALDRRPGSSADVGLPELVPPPEPEAPEATVPVQAAEKEAEAEPAPALVHKATQVASPAAPVRAQPSKLSVVDPTPPITRGVTMVRPERPFLDDDHARPGGWFWPVVIGAAVLTAGGTALAISLGGDRGPEPFNPR